MGALKSKLGVSELPVKMVESVEEQNELVSFIEPAPPVVVQVKLSHKAITAILAVNFGANAAALPIFLHFV